MRRGGDSSQYHDETPRRRVRRLHSQEERLQISDIKGRTQEMSENVPTSPYKTSPFMPPQSPGSMQNPVSPHRTYQHNLPRGSQSSVPPSPHSYHSAPSPSRYAGPSAYMPGAISPSSGICTPSCATPSSVMSPGPISPDFFGHGMVESPAPIRSPIYTDYQREQFTYPQGPSPGGTVHHHGYNAPRRPPPIPSPTGFPNQPSPGGLNPRGMGPVSSPGGLHPPPSPVYRTHNPNLNPDKIANPAGRKHNPVPVGKPADSPETARLRQLVIDYYSTEMENVRGNYREKLQELFFLQSGGNMMDYLQFKRKPTPQMMNFLNSNRLDDNVLHALQSSTPVSLGMPAVSQQMWQPQTQNGNFASMQVPTYEQAGLDPRKTQSHCNYNMNPAYQQYPEGFAPNVSPFTGNQVNRTQMRPELSRSTSVPNPHMVNVPHQNGSNVTNIPVGGHPSNPTPAAIHRSMSVGGQPRVNGPGNPSAHAKSLSYVHKGQSVMSVLDNSFGSQEEIVVEAKKEAEVIKRVNELRKEGLWSTRRLPKVQETPRKKAHWDYLLEEMQWLATDFAQERRWKRGAAKKLSRAVMKHHQELRSKEVRAEKEESVRLKKIASSIAKEVKQFWANVEKVVQYKVQSRLEEKRKKALDDQLNFIVDQTEKYSSWLVESLKPQPSSAPGSVVSTAPTSPISSKVDSEFEPSDQGSDVEETIEEQEQVEKLDREKEIELLQQDSEMTIEEILENLPPQMLEERSDESSMDEDSDADSSADDASDESNESDIEVDDKSKETEKPSTSKASVPPAADREGDKEFVLAEETEEDDEQTLDEQEKVEGDANHDEEIANLEKEGDMPIEELLKIYGTGDDTSDYLHTEEGTPADTSEEEEEEEATEEESTEFLVRQEEEGDTPDDQLTSAAATAESLQPKGFTLETTQIQTQVPFLLRGTLREYQLIGLDWLVTMHEKRLNGILADEMGLGKTIQTISLLAHLACEKGIWGPHLVVVPTSVMLNWEMEFKKWLPGFKILTYYGNQKERKLKRQGWTKCNAFHVCITSYKLVVQDHQAFRRKKWKYFILDEAQNIKNFKSQRWQYLLNFNSQRRLLLTGTPLQNSLMELWSLMHFLMPHLFQSHKDFKEWFSNPLTGMIEGSREYNENLVKRLHKVLRPFLLRRLKSEVETQMPKKYEHVVKCRLSKRQRFLYDDFMSRGKTKETLESGHFLSVINILMQLRKVCNHPDLFEGRPTLSPFQVEGINYYTASLVLRALERKPFEEVSFGYLNLCLADIETTVTSYTAYRTQSLQTPRQLIVEVDSLPDPVTPLVPPVKVRRLIPTGLPVGVSPVKTEGYPGAPMIMHPQGDRQLPSSMSAAANSSMWPQDAMRFARPVTSMQMGMATQRPPGVHSITHPHGTRQSDYVKTAGMSAMGLLKSLPPPPPYPGHTVGYEAYRQHPPHASTTTDMSGVSPSQRNDPLASHHVTPEARPVSQTKKMAVEPAATKAPTPQPNRASPFFLSKIADRKSVYRRDKLQHIAALNTAHCAAQPVYGIDLVKAVTIVETIGTGGNCVMPDSLNELVKSPEQRICEMDEIINRFVFFVPAVNTVGVTMHTSHPPPHLVNTNKIMAESLQKELMPKTSFMHPISRGMTVQFPEARLIQYDCGKLQTLDNLLRRLKAGKHRVLIFTQMTRMLDVLEKFLNYHGYVYLRLDGSTRVEQRQILMDRFNADSRIFCFILSTRSGGLGVNLTGADTVVFYDSDWNPTMDAQAQDRCHRIGQTRDVHIYRLISERTVEENILKKANQKRMLGDIAIEGGNFTTAFLREASLKELFNIEAPEGPEAPTPVKQPEEKPEEENQQKTKTTERDQTSGGPEPKVTQNLFEQALLDAEDETDACAATRAKAEQAAELAEFDEGIPYADEAARDSQREDEFSKVEEELVALESQLTSIERFAVRYLETTGGYITVEQIKEEQQVEIAKKDWEIDHLVALKEQEEKRAAEDEDEILFTYSRENSTQVKKSKPKSRSNSRCSLKSTESKKSKGKSSSAGSQQKKPSVRDSRPSERSSRASSRSSSCSSSGRIRRRPKPKDFP